MYIYKRFDKIFEASFLVVSVLLLYRSVLLGNSMLINGLYVLGVAWWARLVYRHWRAEFSSHYFRAAYRRVLLLLNSHIGTDTSYLVTSPDESRMLLVERYSQWWSRRESAYRVSIVVLGRSEESGLEPLDALAFTVPPPFGYIVADNMVKHKTGAQAATYSMPSRSFKRLLKQALLDHRPDCEMIVTEAELVYIENALLTWHQQKDFIIE